jgi:alanine racemase
MGGRRIDRRSFLGLAAAAVSPAPVQGAPAWQPATVSRVRDSRFDPWIEVRHDHLAHNAAQVARLAGGRPILAVIKNNGYGLGLVPVARALAGVSAVYGFAVVKLHEAITMREAGITKPILLMGPFDAADVADLHAHEIMPMVYTPIGDALARAAQGAGRPISIHLKIDTGLGRIGVPYREAEALARDLSSRKGIALAGLMMTFSEDQAFDREQLRRFEALASALKQSGVNVGRLHAASSYTFFQHENVLLDMVRPGMVLYGVFPDG